MSNTTYTPTFLALSERDTSSTTDFTFDINNPPGSITVTGSKDIDLSEAKLNSTNGIVNIFGSDEAQKIQGSQDADFISAAGGDDTVCGNEGNDTIGGGFGNDIIYGNTGDDVLFGQEGNDTVIGGKGNDALFGNDGNDFLYGNQGQDLLYGNAGNDQLDGGEDNDTLVGGAGDDTLIGGAGDDILIGDEGTNLYVIHKNDGKDSIIDFKGAGAPSGDVIAFTSDVFNSFSDIIVHTRYFEGNAIIDLGEGNSVTVTGLGTAHFSADDFFITSA